MNSDREQFAKDEKEDAKNVKNPIQYEEVVQDENSGNDFNDRIENI